MTGKCNFKDGQLNIYNVMDKIHTKFKETIPMDKVSKYELGKL